MLKKANTLSLSRPDPESVLTSRQSIGDSRDVGKHRPTCDCRFCASAAKLLQGKRPGPYCSNAAWALHQIKGAAIGDAKAAHKKHANGKVRRLRYTVKSKGLHAKSQACNKPGELRFLNLA
jgi:hypothetical protein